MLAVAQKRRKKEIIRVARQFAINHQPKKAVEQIDMYLSTVDSTDTELLVLKGNIYDSQGKFSEARKMYETVLGIEPNNILALTDLGEYFSCCKHDYRRALRYFDKALDLLESRKYHPNQESELVDVCVEKISALLSLGQPVEALKCILRGLEKFPASERLVDSLQRIQKQFRRPQRRITPPSETSPPTRRRKGGGSHC
ncbi:MAG: tetratricopeptide repeat protein [Nitrospira sp.]